MLKSKALPIATIVAMAVFCQPLQAQTPASKTVNQTQSEIQRLRSDVDLLTNQKNQLRSDVDLLRNEQMQLRNELQDLHSDLTSFRRTLGYKADTGLIMFFVGIFCALWAQNTRRNPWLWFFLGVFFNVITVLFVLSKNSQPQYFNKKFGEERKPEPNIDSDWLS